MTSVNNTFSYGDNTYVQRGSGSAETGFLLATTASALIYKALPSFSNPFLKQMTKEHSNNHLYKDAFFKSFKQSGLDKKNVKFHDTIFSFSDKNKLGTSKESEILQKDMKMGLNACYAPSIKTVMLNSEKATISGFHELGHAHNHLSSNVGKLLQKCRKPGYAIAALMGYFALFERNKPKEAKRNVKDFVQDNCGKIAFAAMLPTVVEEAMASVKGVKFAKQSGLSQPLVNNLKKFYGKAWLSYIGYAVVTGFSVFATSKIMEYFTRPKKINPNQ